MNRRHFLAAGAGLVVAPALAAPVPKKQGGLGRILIERGGDHHLLSEDGKVEEEVGGVERVPKTRQPYGNLRISPDGKSIAWTHHFTISGEVGAKFCVRAYDGKGCGTEDDDKFFQKHARRPLFWLGDTRVVTERFAWGKNDIKRSVYEVLDVNTWKFTPFDYPKDEYIADVSADGKKWLVMKWVSGARVWSVRTESGEVSEVLSDSGEWETEQMAISPDGTNLACARFNMKADTDDPENFSTVTVAPLGGKKLPKPDKLSGMIRVSSLRWAPDGKRFAYSCQQLSKRTDRWLSGGVRTRSADGQEQADVLTCTDPEKNVNCPEVVCWR